jgi:hypothetical protein
MSTIACTNRIRSARRRLTRPPQSQARFNVRCAQIVIRASRTCSFMFRSATRSRHRAATPRRNGARARCRRPLCARWSRTTRSCQLIHRIIAHTTFRASRRICMLWRRRPSRSGNRAAITLMSRLTIVDCSHIRRWAKNDLRNFNRRRATTTTTNNNKQQQHRNEQACANHPSLRSQI